MKAGTKLFYSFLNTRTQFSHIGFNRGLWSRAFLSVVRVWSESSQSAQSETILFQINSKIDGSGVADPHHWPGCQSQALKGFSTVFFIQPWPNLSPLLRRSQRRRTCEPDPAPKKLPETRAHSKHHLRPVSPPSLVSMTLASLGCSHHSWQVVSCVAGPEADRDGPRLSDSDAGLTLVPNWNSDRSHWVGNPGRHSVPTILTGGCKPTPLLPNLLGRGWLVAASWDNKLCLKITWVNLSLKAGRSSRCFLSGDYATERDRHWIAHFSLTLFLFHLVSIKQRWCPAEERWTPRILSTVLPFFYCLIKREDCFYFHPSFSVFKYINLLSARESPRLMISSVSFHRWNNILEDPSTAASPPQALLHPVFIAGSLVTTTPRPR